MSARNCTKGKSCGATCIDARERCNLELGLPIKAALSKARNVLERITVRREYLQNQDTDWSPRQAVKWFNANQGQLETFALDQLEGGPKKMWVVGIEPGNNLNDWKNGTPQLYQSLVKKYPNLANANAGEFQTFLQNNPQFLLRLSRDMLESSKIISKEVGQRNSNWLDLSDPRNREMLSQGEFPKGMDVKNMISQIGQKARWNPATFFGRLFPLADKMGMEAIHATNVSTLSSPDTKQWPYKKLFEDAGLPVPKDLRTRGAWMKRQLEVRGDAIANKIVSEKPGLVYLSGGEGKVIFDKVAPKGKVYEQEVKWTSGLGNEQKLTMKAVDLGGTRVVFGPHVTAQTGNAKPVVEARNALLSGDFSKASPVAAPAKVAPKKKGVDPKVADEIKARGGGSSGMADWSVLKLQKAYERAYDAGDDLKMRQIVQVLKNKGALVE